MPDEIFAVALGSREEAALAALRMLDYVHNHMTTGLSARREHALATTVYVNAATLEMMRKAGVTMGQVTAVSEAALPRLLATDLNT